ncbi:thioredoxin family protein [Flavobacterium rakeshii]|uniref:Thioredoxin family protein n=1 Tax=Flavobacterium rakeshii TaxID=1038845 RepID=A0A6N8HDN6_9FLAO|nr:thioredoxin family protein [Flavobacterium rakeshii]MUV03855.1 thioredoxin family protein [Flavobacterium rakeshii]
MSTLIEKSLDNSYSYSEYRNHIGLLLQDGLSTGATQSEDLTNYSSLNEVRMNRLDKTIKLTDDIKARLGKLKKEHVLLVISEGWCGDAAQIVPVISKMANETDKLELEIVLRDDNDELMNEYLTNGARSIPKLVLVEKDTHIARGSWGPRPHDAAKLIRDYKEQHGVIDQEAKTELQKWYLHDKGESTMKEITLLLENAENM